MRYEMKRFLMHRAVLVGVNCAALSLGPIFQPALEHADNSRLATTYRSHQQQDSFAHFETLCGRFEILDDPGYGFLNAKEFVGKEVVGENLVLSAFIQPFDTGGMNHVVDASVGKLGNAGILGD